MHKNSPDVPPKPLGLYFSENLKAALKDSGKKRPNGKPGPVTATWIQENTKVARSTLRALLPPRSGVQTDLKPDALDRKVNPDLDTLDRLAAGLNLPPAFLLMRPQDWQTLGQAVEIIGEFFAAAGKLNDEGRLNHGNPVENVLRACKVYHDNPPIGGGNSLAANKGAYERAGRRNEWRRRHSLLLNALMLSQIQTTSGRVGLAAVASALVSKDTPDDPEI